MAANPSQARPPPPVIDLEDQDEVRIFRTPPLLIDLESDEEKAPEYIGVFLDEDQDLNL